MKSFISVLKNDYMRTAKYITAIIIMTAVTVGFIFLAVYMTGIQEKGRIALVSADNNTQSYTSKGLQVTVLAKKPPYSDLVKQKYEAIITKGKNGQYQVQTLFNDKFKNEVLTLLQHSGMHAEKSESNRGVGVNILGFMMMSLIMLAFWTQFVLADDKENGQLSRIAAAPIKFGGYLAAHCVYSLSMLLPEFLAIVILKLSGWNIGFSLAQYAYLMAITGFLGISFAMLLHSLIGKSDNAETLGNTVTILSTILAGSFYSMSSKNGVMDAIVSAIPQKQILNYAEALQNGTPAQHFGYFLYAVLFSAVLFAAASAILRHKYVKA